MMLNKSFCGLILFFLASTALAGNQNESFTGFVQCKAHYDQTKEEALEMLNKKKQMMGAGMPDFIYVRKRKNIDSEYQTGMKRCESLKEAG